MDELIKELVEDLKKQEKKVEKISEKTNKSAKIVFKANEKGDVEVVGISGSQTALLSAICVILDQMEKSCDDSAEHMATIILTTLEMEKKKND